MDPPVNFDNLRAITGGDRATEADLFQLFFESSEASMQALRRACLAGDETAWRQAAHALKGLCFNLGAEPLGALCQNAQQGFKALREEKQQMLAAMTAELARVGEAINKE